MGLTWQAGAAIAVLPVGAGAPLGGYGSRTAPASGVLRPLEVAALALSAGDGTVVLVTLDLLAVDAEWVTALRDRVAREHGVHPDGVLVAASHTHAGPAGFRRVGAALPPDAAAHGLRRRVLDVAADAVDRAFAGMVEVELRLATGESPVAAHRTDPALPADRRLTRVDLTAADRRPVAVLWHYACHATVLGADNTLVSPDLPGEVRARLRDDVGHDVPVLYLNGAAGDLSTRFTRRDQTPAEVRRLAGLVVDALPDAGRSLPPTVPAGRTAGCRLPAATEDAHDVAARLDRARAALAEAPAGLPPTERRVLDTAVVGLEKRLARLAAETDATGVDTEDVAAVVHVLDLGELLLVGVPGELFSADGERIRDLSAATALPVGYAGDYLGYLPPTGAGAGYEADSAVVAPGAGEVLVRTARDLIAGGRR